MVSKEKDMVLDHFMGSGTTAIASEMLNRKWLGIDNKKEYIELASETPHSKLLPAGKSAYGRTWVPNDGIKRPA